MDRSVAIFSTILGLVALLIFIITTMRLIHRGPNDSLFEIIVTMLSSLALAILFFVPPLRYLQLLP